MNDIWNQLEADFEDQEAKPVELPGNLEPEVKGFTPKERFQEWMLNGTVPSILTATLGLLFIFLNNLQSGIGLEVLLALILVWLCRPALFPGKKVSLVTALLAPLVMGGFVELFSTITDAIGRSLRNENFNQYNAAFVFQEHLESFSSWSHLAIYGLGGIVVYVLANRAERELYWLDAKPPSKLRLASSRLFVFGIPLVSLVLCGLLLWQHPWNAEEANWLSKYSSQSQSHSQPNAWEQMLQTLPPGERSNAILEGESLQLLETTALENFRGVLENPEPGALRSSENVIDLLIYNLDNLKQPELVIMALIRHPLSGMRAQSFNRDRAIVSTLLPYLATAPLEEINDMQAPFSVDEAVEVLNKQYLERLSRAAHWEFRYTTVGKPNNALWQHDYKNEDWRKVKFFGSESSTSPVTVLAQYNHRADLRWWIQFERYASGKSSDKVHEDLQDARKRANGFAVGSELDLADFQMLANQSRIYYFLESELNPERPIKVLLSLAYLIPQIREHHQENGQWPHSLYEFAEQQNLRLPGENLSFDSQTGALTITFRESFDRDVSRTLVLR